MWTRTSSTRRSRSLNWRRRAGPWALYAFLLLLSVVNLSPLVVAALGSLKDAQSLLSWPPRILAGPYDLENYRTILGTAPLFSRWVLNSAGLTVVIVASKVVVASLAGYAFGRLRFPGREAFFWMTLATLMVPSVVKLVPTYVILRSLGWLDTYLALAAPGVSEPFGVFLMTQFFKTLPQDYEDAARIDGATWSAIFARIMLPMARPGILAFSILKARDVWNDFLMPLVFLNRPEMFTLPLGLNLFNAQHYTYWNLVMAGTMFNAIPMILVFLVFQRYFMRGISLTGLKV